MMDQFLPPDDNDYTNRDRQLPVQVAMRQFFQGGYIYDALLRVTQSVLPIKSVHEKFDIQLKPGMTYETLGSDLSTLHFLQLLVRLTGARHVLEIGTYIGVSAMFLAEALKINNGFIVTIEKGKEFDKIARDNFHRNGMLHCIEPILGDALAVVEDWRGAAARPFDMIFLDGAKQDYARLLLPLLDLLRPGALLVVDDVFCQGDTLNLEPTTDKGRGVRNLLDQVAKLEGFSPVILPYGDGLLLLRKPHG